MIVKYLLLFKKEDEDRKFQVYYLFILLNLNLDQRI